MEARSKKSRSLALESQTTSQTRPKRQDLADRHRSAPSVDRKRDSQTKTISHSTKDADASRRSSKASIHDEAISSRHSERPRSSQTPHRRGSQAKECEPVSTVSLVVVGAAGVGKSSFVRNSLDLRRSSSSPFSSSKVSLNNLIYRVQMVELLLEDVEFASGRKIHWPRYLNNSQMPPIDGVFCLYDVTDEESVAEVPQALAALSSSELPCMLVACKTDVPDEDRETSPRFHGHVRRSFPSVQIAETAIDSPESQKRCISSLLNRILASSQQIPRRESAGLTSPLTSPQSTMQSLSCDPSSPKSRSRSRSTSRLRTSRSKDVLLNLGSRPPIIESEDEESDREGSSEDDEPGPQAKTKLRVDTTGILRAHHRPTEPHTPMSSEDLTTSRLMSPSNAAGSAVPETPESYYVKSMLRPSTADTTDSRSSQTFLNMDDEAPEELAQTDPEPVAVPMNKMKLDEATMKETGVPFLELVDRLLLLPTSKSDSKFVPSFLCLYRSFATPGQLLNAIIERFMKTEKSSMVQFTKVAELLRYLQVLGQWTASYPGDFAEDPAREIATAFVQGIEKSKVFAHAAREIRNNLETFVADDDADWAFDDRPTTVRAHENSLCKRTPASSSSSIPSSVGDGAPKATPGIRSGYREYDSDDNETTSSGRTSGAPSTASSILRTGNASSQSYSNLLQLQNARNQVRGLQPNPHIRLSKTQWHHFMETPVDELAKEITRIDWAMYSAIRPREFIRHVTMTSQQKRNSQQSDNISVMVRQFNHLALFVSGMILLRDKPKHRARALEKFMALAWKVRQLNNYNSLGAIVAGINGPEISRLVATRDLIPQEVQKQFLRLTILMGLSRSHAAYRMAWDNSFQERIPFIPLVRQDLTMAASANQTFINKNVNWKKFEIMGDVIVGIQKSLEQPYSFPQRTVRSDDTVRLILESRILDESEDSADPRSELYERSVQVEPQAGTDTKKKFEWLRR